MLQTIKRNLKKTTSAFAAGVLLFSQFAIVPSVGATQNDKVWICHANSAINNVYNKIEVNKSSVDGVGNGDHYLEHTDPVFNTSMQQGDSWGDIIPPVSPYHNGLNWTTEGQAIYNNGCEPDTKGSITVVKDSQPNSYDDFDFTVKKGQNTVSSFELEDDGDENDGQKSYKKVDDLSANTYVITEDPDESGWVLSSITCNSQNYIVDLANKKATVTLAANQDVTCTFVNVPAPTYGSVKVNKKVQNSDGNYVSANGAEFPFRWGLDNEATDNLMGSTQSSVVTGSHQVNENTVNGFEFAGWYYTYDEDNEGQHQTNCKYPQGTTLPVQINVEKNKTKELTFCNKVKKGSITIVKDAQPNSTQDFDFNINQDGLGLYDNFDLEDDGNNGDGEKNYKTFNELKADKYVVEEFGELGWHLSDITCSEGADVKIYKDNGKVVIDLHQGDNVTCTFVNQKKGKIRVYKHTTPAYDQTNFKIKMSGTGHVIGDDDRYIADGEHEDFWVTQGTYSVNETLPDGWVQSSSTCEDVVINAEDLYATCHIYNSKEAKLKIVKSAYPADGQDFMFTSEELGNFTLDVDDDATYQDNKQFNSLKAGDYYIGEEAVNDWEQVYVYCYGADSYWVSEDGVLKVSLEAGNDATCYFVNVKKNTVMGHKFNDVNGNHVWDEGESALANWTIKLTKECTAQEEVVSLLQVSEREVEQDCVPVEDSMVTDENGAYAFTNLDPGTYTVCEVQKLNWTQTYPQDNDGCHKVVIEGPGEVITADFGNKAKPQVLGDSTTKELVNTGASTGKSVMVGLSILSVLGALHLLTNRRKDYVTSTK